MLSVNDVVVDVPTGFPSRSTVYDATPLSSLDAAHERSTFEDVTPEAVGLPGAEGGWSAGADDAGFRATVWPMLTPDTLDAAVPDPSCPEDGMVASASSPVIL